MWVSAECLRKGTKVMNALTKMRGLEAQDRKEELPN
jgi:hypothetical protein